MRISRTYPYPSKLYFVLSNILTFLWRVTRIHFTRVVITKNQNRAHKQLMDLRKLNQELTNSNKEISESAIRSIQKTEKELLKIRDSDIVVKDIDDDELTNIAMTFEKWLNRLLVVLNFLILKPIIFIVECLWNCISIIASGIYKDIQKWVKKKEMKKELLSQMFVVDEDLEITTV